MFKKYLAPVVALTLVAALAIGGTMAYLSDETEEVTNTFVFSEDNIVSLELIETVFGDTYNADGLNYYSFDSLNLDTATTYDMIPGDVLAKNPTVTVTGDDCYVYIQVIEGNNEATSEEDFLEYSIIGSTTTGDYYWGEIDSTNGIYILMATNGTSVDTPYVVDSTTNTDGFAILDGTTETATADATTNIYPASLTDDQTIETIYGTVTINTDITQADMLDLFDVYADENALTNASLTTADAFEYDGSYYVISEEDLPYLTFVAYAVQESNVSATDAIVFDDFVDDVFGITPAA
ncbi:MAG: SipW-dependent-type signal peptide-containing protein [Clostridia bacterium]